MRPELSLTVLLFILLTARVSRDRFAPPKRGKLLPDSSRKGKSGETIVHDAPTVRVEIPEEDGPASHLAPGRAGKGSPPQVVLPKAYMKTDSFSVFSCLDGASKSDTELVDSDVIRDHPRGG